MGDPILFTPGPLTTSATVKAAMQRDVGSRDAAFLETVRGIRGRLVELAGADEREHAAVIVPGSGTYAVEAMVGTVVPRGGKLLVVDNGAYAARIAAIARVLGIAVETVAFAEDERARPEPVAEALARDPAVTHVAAVHCETSTGMVNPIAEIGRAVAAAGRSFLVDAMSSFGGVPLDVPGAAIDCLVSSANKCIEGVPGFAFVIARRSALAAARGRARSVSLDLAAQLDGLEATGQHRFTPPTHALLAFERALVELAEEGGVVGRAARYRANHRALLDGMARLGFEPFLGARDLDDAYVITSFREPAHPRWSFEELYARLSRRGFVIYPGKVSRADCFRIGTIGRIGVGDVEALVRAMGEVLRELEVPVPVPSPAARPVSRSAG